ncbi:MAG TPA: hypothetical protein ENJ61_00245 [Aquifex aeolicus]|uniref:Uncharacterized protein n=1 Tax=Aquifex aeolicus TaxID=63363 RepID=A0A7C5Q7G0_AQUAO|nr:hypothetical protein [Aquifex aeolicus]
MVEVYPHVFEFTVARGSILFDFSQERVVLRLDEGEEKEFPAPVNLHNFCVVAGGILYRKAIVRKQVFFTGKPGERKVIEIRGSLYRKRKEEEQKEEQEFQEGQEQRNRQEGVWPRAFITFIDETENFKRTFLLNIFNLYALWELFRVQDKVVSVDDLVFERKEGSVFIQGVPLPFQKAKALFYALDLYLRTGQIPGINQDWEYGKLMLWNSKKRLDFFKKNGNVLVPSGVVGINADNALRIMSVL